jgi:hypothetical protein
MIKAYGAFKCLSLSPGSKFDMKLKRKIAIFLCILVYTTFVAVQGYGIYLKWYAPKISYSNWRE